MSRTPPLLIRIVGLGFHPKMTMLEGNHDNASQRKTVPLGIAVVSIGKKPS